MMPKTFNFLASLINGNQPARATTASSVPSFNFLASLINGNLPFEALYPHLIWSSFNFLASLINGNKKRGMHRA